MIEKEIHIPKGWDSATLSEITCKLVDGSHNPPPKQDDGFPMLSAINIDDNKINFSSYRLITKSSFELEDCRTRIKAGDVLLTIVGAIGRTAVVPDGIKPFTLQRSVAVLTPILVDPKFLMYQIESPDLSNFFMRNARGTAQKGIYLNFLGGTEILIPPLNEQKRIVAKIEELFSELDKGIENLKTAREQLKVYRQAVLKYAFEGKLTAGWREKNTDKLESVEQLLSCIKSEREEHYQQELREYSDAIKIWETNGKEGAKPSKPSKPQSITFDSTTLPPLPNGWAWECVGNLNTEIFDGPFGSNLKTSDYIDNGVRVIRLENIGYLEFIEEKYSYISENKYEALKKHTVRSGDIVFSSFITDGIRLTILPESIQRAVNKADCFCIRVHGSTLHTGYLANFLSTRGAYKQIDSEIHGIGRPRINTTQLKAFLVPICSSAEQDKILAGLRKRLSLILYAENTIRGEIAKSEALRQSILKKAFSGKLVAQDPDDEPASVLLERIRAEKEAQNAESKRPKAKGNAA